MATDAREAALTIVRDIESRSGLGNVWDEIDPETQDEIVDQWTSIIEKAQ